MRFLPVAALGAAVVAWSAYAGSPTMEIGLGSLMGEDRETAFRVLGPPASSQDFSGDTVYTWTASRARVIRIPHLVPAQGDAGTSPADGGADPYPSRCLIRLTANGTGRLTTWEYEGNLGACRPYVAQLSEYGAASGKI